MTKSLSEKTIDAQTPIRMSGPTGVVSMIPQTLGFQPRESIVIVCLLGPTGRVGPVVRSDLIDYDDFVGDVDLQQLPLDEPADFETSSPLESLVRYAVAYADRVIIVCYHDAPARPSCIDPLSAALETMSIPVDLTLSVCQGTIRLAGSEHAYQCDDGLDAPDDTDPQYQRLAAAHALHGRRVLPNREALVASIRPPSDAAGRLTGAVTTATATIDEAFGPRFAHEPLERDITSFLDTVLADAQEECNNTGALSPDVAAIMIASASTKAARDYLMAAILTGEAEDYLAPLIAAASLCPDEHICEIGCVLAVVAYRCGRGALAHCALDRVMNQAPGHRLGSLVRAFVAHGLPPDSLDSLAG